MRPIRLRDVRALEKELQLNEAWLHKWQATLPEGNAADVRGAIRWLQQSARAGQGLPFVIEIDGALSGQLNVSGLTRGSFNSATLGYWISERLAGRNIVPTAVALATDYCFTTLNLHRMEIGLRTENAASLRVVQKLGFRYEGLRRRFLHIAGDWRDHYSFALVKEEVPEGVLHRWLSQSVPGGSAIPAARDVEAAKVPLLS